MTPTPEALTAGDRRGSFRPSAEMLATCTLLGLMLAAGLVFSPVLTAGFAHPDDRAAVVEAYRCEAASWAGVRGVLGRWRFPAGTGGYYQPLADYSLMGDARVAGTSPARSFQFHLTSLLIHMANVGLVFLILRRLANGAWWAALPAAAVGLHPVLVEPVASVAQRMTLLGGLFCLLAILGYLRYVARGRGRMLALVGVLYAMALLCRPTCVGLPVLLLILDVWPLRRRTARPVLEKLPLAVVGLCAMAGHWWIEAHVRAVRPIEAGAMEILARNISFFASRLVRAGPLSAFYPWPGPIGAGTMAAVGLCGVGLAILAVAGKARPLLLGVAGTAVMVAPGLRDLPYAEGLLGDSYLYLAPAVLAMAATAWLSGEGAWLRRKRRVLLGVTGSGLALLWGVKSYDQCHSWQSRRELYLQAVRTSPDWPAGLVGLVEACIEENELDEALVHARRAAALEPEDPSALFYLGTALLLHGGNRGAEAVAPLRRALASNPDWIECLQNLGVALARSGQAQEAILHLERARDLQPDSAGIRTGLGHAYLEVNRAASARAEFQEALRHGNDPGTHLGLAAAWASNDEPAMARRHLALAVSRDPRLASRAASYPSLRRLHGDPAFADLIDVSGEGSAAPRPGVEEVAPSRGSRGS
jgi:Flp pilus assembly protein TadD